MPNHPETKLKRIFAKTVRWILLSIGGLFVVLVVWSVIAMIRGPQVGEHVSAEAAPLDLPSDATDVCYVTVVPFSPCWGYEFSVSEDSFIKWAEADGYTLQEIGQKPFEIDRYKFITEPESQDYRAVISDGLFYERWTEPDAYIKLAYDRQKKRAYRWARSR